MSLLLAVDLNWLLQFIVTLFLVAFGLLHIVKNTASKYFLAEDNDHDNNHEISDWSNRSSRNQMMMTPTAAAEMTRVKPVEKDGCAVCGNLTKKRCSSCKMVMYCSEACQISHWRSEHKLRCKDFQLSAKSILGGRSSSSAVSLATPGGSSKNFHQSKKILFPYEEFVEYFNWDKPGFPPCGLLNCGNSCFANVVLQCLAYTRPLIAFLLEKGHRRECRRNDWCFLCEFQMHVERASQSSHPFSPINILSRLPNIGGNLGYGKQEDAHEFMRFAIDTMQSVCLDEFGGEKFVHPTSQETTLIQHVFGGHLQSQVICTKCNNVSNQFENMMDLTVEIQGNAASLEECLDQFTAKEWLHGDNMYKCDGCNDYVMAWKHLTVRRAPNILTIALKRFQSGRFGKLNKRVTFPETLDLSPYMSETGEDNNIYKLYAVIVHVDMLNASFFGHYICYIKDFRGKWYRIDDCKVTSVDLDEVLSQGAYMLLYSRVRARSSCLYPVEPLSKGEEENVEVVKEVEPSSHRPVQCFSAGVSTDTFVDSALLPSENISKAEVASCEVGLSSSNNAEDVKESLEMMDVKEFFPVSVDDELYEVPVSVADEEAVAPLGHAHSLVSGKNASNTLYSTEVDVHLSNFKDETGGSKRIPQEYSFRHSLDQDSVATQNHIREREELHLHISAMSSSSEVLEETKTADSVDATGKVACGIPSSNGVRHAARKADGKRSGAKVKPLFAPGFLDKRSQNKYIKRVDKVSAELGEQVPGSNVNCQRNGIAKPVVSCQIGGGIRNGDGAHFGCDSNVCANVLGRSVGMCEKDSQMATSEFDEPSLIGNGSSGDPIVLDEDTTVSNTDEEMLLDLHAWKKHELKRWKKPQ